MSLSAEPLPNVAPVLGPQPHMDAPTVLEVRDLCKHYVRADGSRVSAIDNVSFDLHAGEFMVLLGPSGCGKTTLLRSVAGLESPDSGSVTVDGHTVFSSSARTLVPPERRGLSMVFQSYALWPHMTVFQNVAYPLLSRSGRKPRKSEYAGQVERMLATMKLEGLAGQYPNQLSGGQQQRVALCRALIAGSNVVLFDEPLSNVDTRVRERLRIELLLMQRELGFAALFVTHDQQEAMALAHTIAVLDRGRIVQHASPDRVYGAPATAEVAAFVGVANQIGGVVIEAAGRDVVVNTAVGAIPARRPIESVDDAAALCEGDAATVMWRPEAGRLTEAADCPAEPGRWTGVVEQSWYYGSHTESMVRVGDEQFRIQAASGTLLPRGAEVCFELDQSLVFAYPDNTTPLLAE